MEGDAERFRKRLEELCEQAAELAVEAEWSARDSKPQHYSQIEAMAHRVAQRLSCRIQERAAREVAAETSAAAACPKCGQLCRLETANRTVQSIDGAVELLEPKGFCNRCRRSFFPSAGSTGAGQPRADADVGHANRVRGGRDALA